MELLPIYQSRRGMNDISTEQLIGKDHFEDEFFVRDDLARQRRGRRVRQSGPTLSHQISPHSQYRPPIVPGMMSTSKENGATEDYLFLSGPKPPSLRRALQRQTPQRTQGTIQLDHHENPAKDLAGFFSYGFCCCQCVRTQEVGMTENFGQFQEIIPPGFYCLLWPMSDIAGRLSLRIQQMDVVCETKTKDNVFVHLQISVQYRVVVEKAFDAYYRLTDPSVQLQSYVYDVVRAAVPKLTIDKLFLSKKFIAESIYVRLTAAMNDYGYEIVSSLVTNILPSQNVRDSMNEIEASRRLKEAMPHRAEAEKTRIIKKAEADADSMYLRGCGIANSRCAIMQGMKESLVTLSEQRSTKDVMDLLLLTQYMDMLGAVGGNDLIISHSPGNVESLLQSLPTTHNIVDLLS
jgi:regulator of protease activity HflC (stomatin/prohibitin superfamily)